MTELPLRDLPLAECTVPALLEAQADRYGGRELLRIGELRRDFREMRDAVAGTAGMLRAEGLRHGDHIAMLCTNRVELLDLILGCAWLGATAVPLNVALRGAGLRHALADSGCRVLILEPELLDRLDAFELPDTVERVWVTERTPRQAVAGRTVELLPPRTQPIAPAEVRPGDTMAILYTSGTTGVSKGVCCPHAQFYWWGINVCETLEITERDVLYTVLPLYHTNALNCFAQALVSGARYVLGGRFSASAFWTDLRTSEATVTYLLGAMVNILYSKPPGANDRAHRVRRALAPASPSSLFLPFQDRFGITLVDGFGSTETNMVIGARPGEQRPGYLGKVLPGFQARVVDELDLPVPDGTAGELVLRADDPFAFATGYHHAAEQTVQAWRDLWFHTGDRVVRESDGWFRFLDRIKDAIRRRGENISSFEVEQVLGTHPAVDQVAVFAVPSELAEDEVMAAVVVKPELGKTTAADLAEHCVDRLAYFAIPRFIDLVDALPLTANGKVRKAELRKTGVRAETWDRMAQP
ncbi:crotonobetaine/carnitine-CoA ligase [Tamaricihabitans halophyticus]|uniref:Crotonobetaine/carnitine-CoA ligase n=1 Tax=Tamaricihabitans halophyticus TaxID=1262583 RepID=A0A4V2SUL4_9PSEU|nr:ATP-dependent acyl-CoA ligase [Tamaricihabitans halophyticus]TCP55046.1 crotonobetaine/carnitine-CoA ligase [Tamaricihabitans halophyticus]